VLFQLVRPNSAARESARALHRATQLFGAEKLEEHCGTNHRRRLGPGASFALVYKRFSKSAGNPAKKESLRKKLMAKKNGHTQSPSDVSPSKSHSKKTAPSAEAIQLRAYEIYLERNGAPGNPLEDWVQAERELLAKPRRPAKKLAATAAAN
jgi:hypothetical protein